MFNLRSSLLLISSALLVACSDGIIQTNPVIADKDIHASFAVDKVLTPSKTGAYIVINKSALEKEFLLQTQFLSQTVAPRFNGIKSRVVAFKHVRDRVLLLEATKGHVITDELPAELILASLPVVSENKTALTVDFNTGMSEIFLVSDWYASDFEGTAYGDSGLFASTPLANAYIADSYLSSRNDLTVIQRGQIREGASLVTVESRYYISPYNPDPSYSPVLTTDFKRVGYFEVAPLLTADAVTKTYASRHDPSEAHQIVFAVSSNTPAEYKQAVKDGVLYWNQAFGYEKVRVVDAPAGVTAPNPDFNIVQWVNWDTAGSAYADAQMDPRTGQILHAQVFMTSAFAFGGRARARWLLQKLDYENTHPDKIISIGGIKPSLLCDKEETSRLREALTVILNRNLDDEKIMEISRDYIREVVAHEIGHTLGLRHNFAGNLGANRTIPETRDDYNRYLTSLRVDAKNIYSSSVMEYQQFIPSTLTGRLMVDQAGALPYDKMAIDYLYKGISFDPYTAPLFCTDTHAALGYTDCLRFDEGPSALENAEFVSHDALKNVPRALLVNLLSAKFPASGVTPRNFDEVLLDADVAAKNLFASRAAILTYLTRENKDLRIHRKFSRVDSTNLERVLKEQAEYAASEIARLGGLESALSMPDTSIVDQWSNNFKNLITSDSYRTGVGLNGAPYELSDKDIELALTVAEDYFTALYAALPAADLALLTSASTSTLSDTSLSDTFAELLRARASRYVLATSEKTIDGKIKLGKDEKTGEEKSADVQLPVFLYPQKVRVAAASLLVGKKSESPVWGLNEHNALKAEVTAKLKEVLAGNELSAVKLEGHERQIARWLSENKSLMTALSAR